MQKLEITIHTKYARHAPLDVGLICLPIYGGIRIVMIFVIGFQRYGRNGPKKTSNRKLYIVVTTTTTMKTKSNTITLNEQQWKIAETLKGYLGYTNLNDVIGHALEFWEAYQCGDEVRFNKLEEVKP